MRLWCVLLGVAWAASGCAVPPAKVSGRLPIAPAAATPPSSVTLLVRPPAGRSVKNVGLVYAGDYDLTSVMSELRTEAAALCADAVTDVSVEVSNGGAIHASGTAVRWQ